MSPPARPTALQESWLHPAWQCNCCQTTCGKTSSMDTFWLKSFLHSSDRKSLAGEKRAARLRSESSSPCSWSATQKPPQTLATLNAVNHSYQVKRKPICWLRIGKETSVICPGKDVQVTLALHLVTSPPGLPQLATFNALNTSQRN